MPGRARRAITRSPWVTRARFSPVSGITSHTVASATMSRIASRSGSRRAAKKPVRRSSRSVPTAVRNAIAAAHSVPRPEPQSSRFGLTVANTDGGGPSAWG